MSDSELLNAAKCVLRIEREALENAENSLGEGFLQAVHLLLNRSASGRVVVMGMGKSGHIGNKIAATRDFRAGDVRHSLADISKATKLLGYESAHRIGEGLKVAMNWYIRKSSEGDA